MEWNENFWFPSKSRVFNVKIEISTYSYITYKNAKIDFIKLNWEATNLLDIICIYIFLLVSNLYMYTCVF